MYRLPQIAYYRYQDKVKLEKLEKIDQPKEIFSSGSQYSH
jgi:hypothetical protein